jgi:hypothetical protein
MFRPPGITLCTSGQRLFVKRHFDVSKTPGSESKESGPVGQVLHAIFEISLRGSFWFYKQ